MNRFQFHYQPLYAKPIYGGLGILSDVLDLDKAEGSDRIPK